MGGANPTMGGDILRTKTSPKWAQSPHSIRYQMATKTHKEMVHSKIGGFPLGSPFSQFELRNPISCLLAGVAGFANVCQLGQCSVHWQAFPARGKDAKALVCLCLCACHL